MTDSNFTMLVKVALLYWCGIHLIGWVLGKTKKAAKR